MSGTGANFSNANRISKANLKDYGMTIITGGKAPAGMQGAAVTSASGKMVQNSNEAGMFAKQVHTPL